MLEHFLPDLNEECLPRICQRANLTTRFALKEADANIISEGLRVVSCVNQEHRAAAKLRWNQSER
jgi:hypothetical protein